MRRGGVSLLELIIAMTIAAIITTLLTSVIIQALGWSRQGGTSTFQFTEGSLALERMTRELGSGSLSLLQDPDTLREGTSSLFIRRSSPFPGEGGWTHASNGEDQEEVIRYCYDQARQRLLRTLYDPEFDPDNPLTQKPTTIPGNPRVLATSLKAVSFSLGEDHLLGITLIFAAGAQLRTKVAAPSLMGELERW